MPTCKTCKYFYQLENQCRINPPTVFTVQQAPNRLTGEMQIQIMGTFPPVQESHWCGKHSEDLGKKELN